MFRRSTASLKRTAAESYAYQSAHYIPGGARWPFPNLVMQRAKGSYMYDVDDKTYLDFIMGIGVNNLGHTPDELVSAVHKQVDLGWHFQVNQGFHEPMERFIGNMIKSEQNPNGVLPKAFDQLFCYTSGSEAVEGAIKMARQANPGRPCLAGLRSGYHGRTVGAASLTTSKYTLAMGCKPHMPGCVFLPIPYHSAMAERDFTKPLSELSAQCLELAEDVLTQQCHASEVAMLISEPCLGEGGFVPLPAEYLQGLRDICTKNGILLCADEVQSGFGRTGSLFYHEQTPMQPDMMTFAKGVANGMPLSGLATRKDIAVKAVPGTQGGTYSGNAVAMAAANAAIENFYGEPAALAKLMDNVWARSEQLVGGMLKMIEKHNLPIDEIRGRGLMLGIEWNRDVAGLGANFTTECYKRNMLLPTTGKFNACRMIPSLRLTEGEANEALAIMEEAAVAAVAAVKDQESVKKATKGGAPVTHFFEDGFLPDSPKPNVPLRWVTVRK